MKIVCVYVSAADDAPIRFDLSCGHIVRGKLPSFDPNDEYPCPTCDDRRRDVQPCTDAELDAVAIDYAATMRARGFTIGLPEEAAIRRAATIQDAWRVAFKRVLGK